ncbi:MAG: hopanoid-associated sugar epimerase [Candidatus Bipolaricaulia bacterium]
MRAFVTGGTGFIGSSVVRVLLERNVGVRALCRPGSIRANMGGLDVEIVEGDLREAKSIRRGIAGCELVFHVAALYSFWVKPRGLIYEVNVEGTRAVFEAAKAAGVERIVYTSSVAALGLREDGKAADETTPTSLDRVVGDYKKSKYLAEQLALEYAQEMPIVLVNPSFPVGPRDIKPTPTGQTIVDFLNRKMPAYIETGMNIVDVEDVALGHWQAAECGRAGERYILGGENVTMKGMLDLLAEITGLSAPTVRVPYGPILALSYLNAAFCRLFPFVTPRMTPETIRMSSHYMYFDPAKAVRELGFPQTPARDALAKAVAWYRENGYVES